MAKEPTAGKAIIKTGGTYTNDNSPERVIVKSTEKKVELSPPTARETDDQTPDSDTFSNVHVKQKPVTLGDPVAHAKYEAWKRKQAGKDSDSSSSQDENLEDVDSILDGGGVQLHSGETSVMKTDCEFLSNFLPPSKRGSML